MVTPAAKQDAVTHLQATFQMSERRACSVIGCHRMTIRHRSTRPDDGILRDRLRALAHVRRRFGYTEGLPHLVNAMAAARRA